jgi:hypothetical protein
MGCANDVKPKWGYKDVVERCFVFVVWDVHGGRRIQDERGYRNTVCRALEWLGLDCADDA